MNGKEYVKVFIGTFGVSEEPKNQKFWKIGEFRGNETGKEKKCKARAFATRA